MLRRSVCSAVLAGTALALSLGALAQAKEAKPSFKELKVEKKRQEIDKAAQAALDRLFAKSPAAKTLFDKAYGYAVFDNLQMTLIFEDAFGKGVAVDKKTGTRTYMKMAGQGLAFGVAGAKYQTILLFETQKTFDDFVNHGWQDTAGAASASGAKGTSKQGGMFEKGEAIYQLNDKGVMAELNVAGYKFVKDDDLNK